MANKKTNHPDCIFCSFNPCDE